MLPLLISVLTMPISLFTAIVPWLYGMVCIAALVLAMFSPEHAVAVAFGFVFAKAGVKARAKEAAAMIKILIGPPQNETPAQYWLSEYAQGARSVSRRKIFLCAA